MTFFRLMKFSTIGFFVVVLLSACSSESAFSKAEDNLDNMKTKAITDFYEHKDEYEDNHDDYRNGYDDYDDYDDDDDDDYYDVRSSSSSRRSTLSSSSYRSSSSSNRSSSNPISQYDYITTSKTLNFTVTHYKQLECTMEGKSSKKCNYDDGDPRVTFEITFYQTDGDSTTYSTKERLGEDWFYYENIGVWDGGQYFTVFVPAYTKTIKVCPHVVDVDEFGFHDKMYSNYCYLTYSIGKQDYLEVNYESDYANDYCELEWEWFLY